MPKKPFLPFPFSGLANTFFSFGESLDGFRGTLGGAAFGGGDLGVFASFLAVVKGFGVGGAGIAGRLGFDVTCLALGAGDIFGTFDCLVDDLGQHW